MLTLIKFGAVWCNPCKGYSEILHNLKIEYPDGFELREYDVEDESENVSSMLTHYQVRSVPTTVILDENCKVIFKRAGAIQKDELINLLKLN